MREGRNMSESGGHFPEGKRRTAGRGSEGADELMNNQHMVP